MLCDYPAIFMNYNATCLILYTKFEMPRSLWFLMNMSQLFCHFLLATIFNQLNVIFYSENIASYYF